ncbi:MAG: hypothetical protein Fur0020_01820 [Thermodesulfovibrionia bacterium]
MPKQIKKRVSKKPVLKEEEFKGSLTQVIEYIKERKRVFIPALAIILAIVILSLSAIYYNSSLKEKAYKIEIEAYNYYYGTNLKENIPEDERWKKALELYKKSVETKPSPTALFYLGNCYYNLSDYTKAIEEYERFIKRFGGEKELLPIVYQKLSSAYLNKGDKDNALSTINRLAELDNGMFKDTALMLEARYYEKTGNNDKAKERYKEITEKFPTSPWVNEAKIKTGVTEKK